MNSLREDLLELMDDTRHDPLSPEPLSAKLNRLCEFIVCEKHAQLWERWSGREDIRQSSESLRATSARALSLVEKRRAFRAYAEKRDADLYTSLLSAAVHEEGEYARIDRNASVIFIGAGAFPLSAITIARETSARVLCTDIDDEAVRHGSQVARLFGLKERFQYIDSPMSNREFLCAATHVFIASLVQEKLEVLEELTSEVRPDCKIIVRYGNGLKSLFNYPLEVSSLTSWQTTSFSRGGRIYDTLLLQPLATATAAGSIV
ncbi:MAG: hypothetical protein K0Q59_5078 [Paenibacillus sp.]|jgi:hypothetical protein|nr:hypothetical protein [Paenibacillus sp.]